MIVRIVNAVLGSGLLLFFLFAAIPPGARHLPDANATFERIAGEFAAHSSHPIDSSNFHHFDGDGSGLGPGERGADELFEDYSDGCLMEEPEEWSP
jgi:hypothetical protein